MIGKAWHAVILTSAVAAVLMVLPAAAQRASMSDAEFLKWAEAHAQKYAKDWDSHDLTAVMNEYTDHSERVGLTGVQRGRQEIQQRIEQAMRSSRDFDNHADQAHVNGNEAWVVGHWAQTFITPSGEARPLKGYWVTIYERAGNDWKNRVEIANVTPPAPPKPAQ